jgi:acyl-coenzyme A synthetase/AMP-(fatty) acid ligase
MSFACGTIIFLCTLLLGGALSFFDPKAIGLAGLANWLDDERAEVMEATPSLVRSLVRTLAPGRVLSYLRVVDFAGEPLYGGTSRSSSSTYPMSAR